MERGAPGDGQPGAGAVAVDLSLGITPLSISEAMRSMDLTLEIVLAFLAVGALLTKFVRRINRFLRDWEGEPQRDGVPPRPGVMATLQELRGELKMERRRGVRRDALLMWLIDRVRQLEQKAGIPWETPPPIEEDVTV